MKKILISLFCMACLSAHAQLVTKGDGTTYTMQSLAEMWDSGIVVHEAEPTPDYRQAYELTIDITISETDKFVMDDNIEVILGEDVTLTIEGEADFGLSTGSTFLGKEGKAALKLGCKQLTTLENCCFQNVSLELTGEGGVVVSHCSFYDHDGSSAAALYFISGGAESTIENCIFERCGKAAIGSAANASQPMTVKDCTISHCSTQNKNVPQINVTASNGLTITGCTIEGMPELNMVGGIGISNFMGFDANVTVSGCTITSNRYGIGLVGPAAHIVIEGNTLKDNCHEQNAMNGGSGISLYDPYLQTSAIIKGNHIEGSLWGITVIGCKEVNAGRIEEGGEYSPGLNTFKDNGNGGQLYDLYNNSAITVYAQGNTWNVSEQMEEQIETVIFHQNDDSSLGKVIFMPAAVETKIEKLEQQGQQAEVVYNLQGQRMRKGQHGIFVVNGKKMVR